MLGCATVVQLTGYRLESLRAQTFGLAAPLLPSLIWVMPCLRCRDPVELVQRRDNACRTPGSCWT